MPAKRHWGIAPFLCLFLAGCGTSVPMNNRLEAEAYSGAEAAAYWTETYLPRWTFWNHVRATAAAGSAICYLVACAWLAQATMASG